MAGDVLFEETDLLAVEIEPLLLFQHPLLGRGLVLQSGLEFVLRPFEGPFEVGAPAGELVGFLAPGVDLVASALHLGAQAAHLAVVRLQALVEQLEAPAAAGAGGAQPFAVDLGGFELGLGAVEILLEPGAPAFGGGQLFLEVLALLGHPFDLAGDLLLLGRKGVGFGVEAAVAGGGILHARPAHGQLLAELGHFALEPVGLAGEGGALGHQAVEEVGGVVELAFEVGDLPGEDRQRSLPLQHAGSGHLAFDVEGAGLHPDAFAAQEGEAGMEPGQPLGVRGGAHQEGGGKGGGEVLGEAQGLAQGEDHRRIVHHRPGLGGAGLALDEHGGRTAGEGGGEAAGALARLQHHGIGETAEVDVEGAFPTFDGVGLARQVDGGVDAGRGERLGQGGPALGVGAGELV